MEFDFDEHKSAANLAKHGIDFVAAQALWEDINRLEVPARTVGEPRFRITGMIGAHCWSAIVTYRGSSVRIISVRRSRVTEVEQYENERI